MNYIKMVEEFHKTFQAPILESVKIPSRDRCDLRVNLLQEELDELKEAIINNDLTEILDAMCDLQYVLSGAILEFGLKGIFDQSFDRVHQSNMSKACNSVKEAIETLSYYKKKDRTEGFYKEVNGKWIVYRNVDNKVLKSINYSPVDLKYLLKDNE